MTHSRKMKEALSAREHPASTRAAWENWLEKSDHIFLKRNQSNTKVGHALDKGTRRRQGIVLLKRPIRVQIARRETRKKRGK